MNRLSETHARLIMQTERTSLHRADDGHHFLISPMGHAYPVDPAKPELFRVCAIWLGLTVDELCRRMNAEQ
jgi:hypothetical protein